MGRESREITVTYVLCQGRSPPTLPAAFSGMYTVLLHLGHLLRRSAMAAVKVVKGGNGLDREPLLLSGRACAQSTDNALTKTMADLCCYRYTSTPQMMPPRSLAGRVPSAGLIQNPIDQVGENEE